MVLAGGVGNRVCGRAEPAAERGAGRLGGHSAVGPPSERMMEVEE